MNTKEIHSIESSGIDYSDPSSLPDDNEVLKKIICELAQNQIQQQEQIEQQSERIEELEENDEEQDDRLDGLEQETDEQQEQIDLNESRLNALTDASIETDEAVDDLEQETNILDNRITAISDGLERLEANNGNTNPRGDDDDTAVEYAEPKTPLELLLDDPENSGIRITPSVDRALKIAGHIKEWSEKAPAGRVIKDGLKKLLSTVEEESLAWRQIYRACGKLDELTNGRIGFEKHDRHGRMVVLRDEEYLSNVVSAGGGTR